jgi:superfamily I DNA and/or RNA helicase
MLDPSDVVVCALFMASQETVSKVLHPDVIIVDEVGIMHESLLWPVLAVYDLNVFLLLGDDCQLRPHSTSSRESNPFRPQYQTSLLSRLVASGSLAGTLAVQHRMTTDIAWLLNSVFYCGRLWTYPTTHYFVRHEAKKIRDFNRLHSSFMRKSNMPVSLRVVVVNSLGNPMPKSTQRKLMLKSQLKPVSSLSLAGFLS